MPEKQIVALHLKLSPFDIELGGEQIHLILIAADGKVRLRLLDLLVGLLKAEHLLFDTGVHLGIVELNDQIFGARKSAERSDASHLHGSEKIGRDESDGARGAKFAAGKAADDDVATPDFGGRDLLLVLGQVAKEGIALPCAGQENGGQENAKDYFPEHG